MDRTIHVESSDGVTIAVHDLTGSGPERSRRARGHELPVLLVCHATGFCGRAYQPLADELAGAFHVLALDFRGHGDSMAPPDGNFDWGAMTDDVLAAVDAGSGGRAVAGFGHSLGGGVLMLAELRRPGTLSGALLFEPIILPDGGVGRDWEAPAQLSESARRRRRVFSSRAEALYRYASRPPLNALQAGALAAYVEHGMADQPDGTVALKCSPESEAATFEAGGKPTYGMLGGVTVPVVVAVGTTERGWTPARFGPGAADALPLGMLERHPVLGHFGPLQGPATVAGMIRETLG